MAEPYTLSRCHVGRSNVELALLANNCLVYFTACGKAHATSNSDERGGLPRRSGSVTIARIAGVPGGDQTDVNEPDGVLNVGSSSTDIKWETIFPGRELVLVKKKSFRGDLCYEAPTRAVAQPSRSSATGSIDNSPRDSRCKPNASTGFLPSATVGVGACLTPGKAGWC